MTESYLSTQIWLRFMVKDLLIDDARLVLREIVEDLREDQLAFLPKYMCGAGNCRSASGFAKDFKEMAKKRFAARNST